MASEFNLTGNSSKFTFKVNDNLFMRPFGASDHRFLSEVIFADDSIIRIWGADLSTREARANYASDCIARWNRYWGSHGIGVWAICSRGPSSTSGADTIIGFKGFDGPLSEDGQAESVAAFLPTYSGRGISSMIGRICLNYVFSKTETRAAYSIVSHVLNPASARVQIKQGYLFQKKIPYHTYIPASDFDAVLKSDVARVSTASPDRLLQILEETSFRTGQALAANISRYDTCFKSLLDAAMSKPSHNRDEISQAIDRGLSKGISEPLLSMFGISKDAFGPAALYQSASMSSK